MASITGVPRVRTSAEPCRSSQGELSTRAEIRSEFWDAHKAAIRPPVEWPISTQLVVIGGDQLDGGVQFQRIVVEIGDEAPQVPTAQAAAVTAEVDREEVVADVAQVVGQVGLEEVVVPAVQIEHRRPGAGVGGLADERGDQLDIGRLARRG